MDTSLRRIDLATTQNLEAEIQNLCATLAGAGYHLTSTFTYQNQLVLVFQK